MKSSKKKSFRTIKTKFLVFIHSNLCYFLCRKKMIVSVSSWDFFVKNVIIFNEKLIKYWWKVPDTFYEESVTGVSDSGCVICALVCNSLRANWCTLTSRRFVIFMMRLNISHMGDPRPTPPHPTFLKVFWMYSLIEIPFHNREEKYEVNPGYPYEAEMYRVSVHVTMNYQSPLIDGL